MKPDTHKLLQDLDKTPYGKALRDFCDFKYKEIGDIRKATNWENTQGRIYALNFIDSLLSFMEETKPVDKSKGSQYL